MLTDGDSSMLPPGAMQPPPVSVAPPRFCRGANGGRSASAAGWAWRTDWLGGQRRRSRWADRQRRRQGWGWTERLGRHRRRGDSRQRRIAGEGPAPAAAEAHDGRRAPRCLMVGRLDGSLPHPTAGCSRRRGNTGGFMGRGSVVERHRRQRR